ncbi:HU family DNA-binding protein [Pelotomaculum propionicicum]|uniref:DNA-binding protein HU n=1 Tax=Pelotomaculum propionicicum TaxID=258475 RepID=A0A4Y7RLH0_9FIRM|nr:HU family DNA-binding protein [Pelotomaculum propionicicum]NLI12936.1 HU family DNA-binding protein [Peptococcaceae bacterium]TEB09838.1 DNA-binding protein HU [Pelotomaculum propionicicum]
MNKTELVNSVREKANLSLKNFEEALKAVLSTITQTLAKGDKIQLLGFGAFETKERGARKGRNPQNGAEIKISAKRVVVFKPSNALKSRVK